MTTANDQETIAGEIQTAVRHSAVYGFGGILAKALGFCMLPFYTHYLTPVDYGTLEILDLSMSLIGMFLNMGVTAALMRYYAAGSSREAKNKTVSTALVFVMITGLITFLLGIPLVGPVCGFLFGSAVPATYLLLSLASLILAYILSPARTYLRLLEASGTFVLVESGGVFLILVLNFIFIAILKIGLLGILLSSVIILGIQALLLSAWTLHRVGIRFNMILLRKMVGFGLPLIASNLGVFTLNFSDRFFLQHLRSLEVVGIYAVGYKFGYMLNYLLVQPFSAMWEPRRYTIYGQTNHGKVFGQIFVLYAALLTFAWLALSILSPEIVHFMVGPQFAASRDVIPIAALAYVVWGLGYYAQLGMLLMNKTGYLGIISAVTVVVNLSLNYFLILRFGMLGAAWATLLSFVTIAVMSYWWSQRVLPLPLGGARVVMVLGVGVALYLLSRWSQPDSFALALLEKGLLLCSFPVLLWKGRILSRAEIGTLASTWSTTAAGLSRRFRLASQKAAGLSRRFRLASQKAAGL